MLPVKGATKNVESDENLFSSFKLVACGMYIYEKVNLVSNQKHTKIKFGFVFLFFLPLYNFIRGKAKPYNVVLEFQRFRSNIKSGSYSYMLKVEIKS